MSVFNVNEEANATYSFTITDDDGNAVQPTALTLTYYDRENAAIINSRTAQDVFNANNVTVVNGLVTWSLQALDTALQNTASDKGEIHVAEWEWTAVSKVGRHTTRIRVINFLKVT